MRMAHFATKKNNNNNARYGGYTGCNKRVFSGSSTWEAGQWGTRITVAVVANLHCTCCKRVRENKSFWPILLGHMVTNLATQW